MNALSDGEKPDVGAALDLDREVGEQHSRDFQPPVGGNQKFQDHLIRPLQCSIPGIDLGDRKPQADETSAIFDHVEVVASNVVDESRFGQRGTGTSYHRSHSRLPARYRYRYSFAGEQVWTRRQRAGKPLCDKLTLTSRKGYQLVAYKASVKTASSLVFAHANTCAARKTATFGRATKVAALPNTEHFSHGGRFA